MKNITRQEAQQQALDGLIQSAGRFISALAKDHPYSSPCRENYATQCAYTAFVSLSLQEKLGIDAEEVKFIDRTMQSAGLYAGFKFKPVNWSGIERIEDYLCGLLTSRRSIVAKQHSFNW